MPSILIYLSAQEKLALLKLAKQELRDPRKQAYIILIRELQRRGLLEDRPENRVSGGEYEYK